MFLISSSRKRPLAYLLRILSLLVFVSVPVVGCGLDEVEDDVEEETVEEETGPTAQEVCNDIIKRHCQRQEACSDAQDGSKYTACIDAYRETTNCASFSGYNSASYDQCKNDISEIACNVVFDEELPKSCNETLH